MGSIWDMHCHFVPGVDDGSEDMEMSMKLLEMDYEDGVRNIIITPHFRRKMFTPPDELVVTNFEKLRKKAKKAFPDLNLYLGCEMHKHSEMMELLEKDTPWKKTMAGSSYLLLEFKDDDPLSRIEKYANMTVRAGYKPILAHIERYEALKGREDVLEKLRHLGVKLQVNADSIIGLEGWGVKRKVKKWLKAGLISFIGSDGHNLDDRQPHMGKAAKKVEKLLGRDRMEHIMVRNPRRIVDSLKEVSDFI